MKKKFVVITFAIVVIGILLSVLLYQNSDEVGTGENMVLAQLPEYENSECYYGKGFQDYTSYCKYYYGKNVLTKLGESSYLKKADADDIDTIISYFNNFRMWIEHEEYNEEYDFDEDCVSMGDYFYIENQYGEEFEYNPEKYPTYNVYYFDTETLTMYFIHNNI